jgi:hypothetical protein
MVGTLGLCALSASAVASVTVNYTEDAGGNNNQPLNGLSARATFELAGSTLSILVENTSLGVPIGFESSDQLLVSLGWHLPDGVELVEGVFATIAAVSRGIGAWSALSAGDSVAEEWVWTNDGAGDLLESYPQVISTSNGLGSGTATGFGGHTNDINGPFGGIAASTPHVNIPAAKKAVSNGILFELTLSDTLTEQQLVEAANSSIVEFGSDQQYLAVPEPATAWLLAIAGIVLGRRRANHR